MKRYPKARKKVKALKKARNRQNADRIEAGFSKYFIDIGNLQNTLTTLLHSSPQENKDPFSSYYTKPADVDIIESYERIITSWKTHKYSKHVSPAGPVWTELSHRMDVVAECHSPLLWFSSYKKSINALNQRLRKLRQELRRNYSQALLIQISQLVAEVRQLASEAHKEYKFRSRKFHGKLFSFQRDLRYTFRQIIRFLFKNLNDETAHVNTLFVRVRNKWLLTTVNIKQDELQEKEMDRFHRRSA